MNIFLHRTAAWLSVILSLVALPYLSQRVQAQVAESEIEAPTPPQTSDVQKTVAVVAVAHYEKLLSDISALGTLLGRPEAGQMVDGGFSLFTQGKGPGALDKKKPWGVIVETDGSSFSAIGCLPVAKPDAVLEIATAYGAKVSDIADGVKEILLPNQKSIYFKQQDGWAFVSLSPAGLRNLPQDPQAILADLVTDYDVAVQISMQDVPEMYRQFAIQAMQAGVQQKMAQQPDETDEQYELRRKVTEAQMVQMQRALNETATMTIGWAIDAAQQQTYVDYTQQFVPGSKMAQQIEAYGQPQTNFAGFYQPEAAATMSFVTKADPEVIRQDLEYIESTMQTMRAGFNNGIDNSKAKNPEAMKAAFSDWFDALEATIRAGEIDGGVAVHTGSDSLTLVAGAIVKDTDKIESGLKKLEEAAAKSPDFPGINWNADSQAGVSFHTLSIPIPEDQEAPRKVLGDEANIAVGIGPERVYVAIGRDNLEMVKQAIDASAAQPDKSVPPFELTISLGPIMEMAAAQADDGNQKEIAESVAEMLRNEAQGRDHVRMVGQMLPNGMRYRIVAEEGALRAVGAAANEAQRQQLQAQQ